MPQRTRLGLEYSQFEDFINGCPNSKNGRHEYVDCAPLIPDANYYRYGEPHPRWQKCIHCDAYVMIDSGD